MERREFVTYLNGRVIPHSQAMAEIQRSGIQNLGGFYDAERTFGGRVFKLRQHLHRMYNGLDYSRIDPGVFLLGLLLIKLWWQWAVPDLFPGAVEQGLVAASISWFTSFKLALALAALAALAGSRRD